MATRFVYCLWRHVCTRALIGKTNLSVRGWTEIIQHCKGVKATNHLRRTRVNWPSAIYFNVYPTALHRPMLRLLVLCMLYLCVFFHNPPDSDMTTRSLTCLRDLLLHVHLMSTWLHLYADNHKKKKNKKKKKKKKDDD